MRIQQFIDYLDVTKPVKIEILSKTKKNTEAAYWGLYRNNLLDSHLIRVYGFSPSRGLESLIAHELIHAWQEEKGITDSHGIEFQVVAKDIQEELELNMVFIKGTDI